MPTPHLNVDINDAQSSYFIHPLSKYLLASSDQDMEAFLECLIL